MVKKVLLLGVTAVFVLTLGGCATTRKDSADLQTQGLRNRVLALESQLREKEDEVNILREAMASSSAQAGAVAVDEKDKVQATSKQIQTALKNAGFYQGGIDGKLGKNTRRAVREFQKANNLPVDGKVGKKTWAVLKDYLEKKVK